MDSLRDIRFFKIPNLFRRQLDLDTRNGLIDAILGVQPDDRVLAGVTQCPRDRNLRHADSLLASQFLYTIDDCLVGLGLARTHDETESRIGVFAQGRARSPRSGEGSARDRRPRDKRYAAVKAVRDHFTLFFTGYEIVVVLHGDEFVSVVAHGDVLKSLEPPSGHLQEGKKGRYQCLLACLLVWIVEACGEA